MVSESVIRQIAEIVGKEHVLQGRAALEKNFPHMGGNPQLVKVLPRDEYDLAEVADLATQKGIAMYTLRRDKMDPALAAKDGILIDVSRMNNIKLIDRRNLTANIGAGVTFEQLIPECTKNDCKLLLPCAATSHEVLRNYLNRDALMGCSGFRHPQLTIFHAVLSDGRIWVSGAQQMTEEGMSDFREDQGPQFSLFFGASEDIFGIPFYGIVYTYPLREARKVQLFAFDDLKSACDLAYKVSREEHCFEVFTANARYLSVLLSKSADEADALREKLPPWMTVVSNEHHSELVEMWSGYAAAAATSFGGKPVEGDLVDKVDAQLQKPWYISDRDYYKGDTRHIFSYDFYSNVPKLTADVAASLDKNGFAASEVGQLVVPVYYGGSAYIESDIYFADSELEAAEKASLEAFKLLVDSKSLVDKPVGKVADYIFGQADEGYLRTLKLFKKIVDPSGILNPEQLLEGV